MRHLPLFLDLRGRRSVVVGGGPIAGRKVRLLLESGAAVTVVAPALTADLVRLAQRGRIAHLPESFSSASLDGAWLVVAATGDSQVNAAVAKAAEARGIWVNVVDDKALSTAIMPAIVDRSPILIAVTSGGSAPMLARWVRAQLLATLDESVGRLGHWLAGWRARIRTAIPQAGARRRFYERLLHPELFALARAGNALQGAAWLERCLAGAVGRTPAGRVVILGAGPGDPGLMTLHGLRALQRADVILHDRLVPREILTLARREAELIAVGKTPGGPATPQDAIHALLARHARAGRQVVRLKGGDPFVFGRGGEEIEFLRREGIAYEVIPGITAALACAALAEIPLTHRGIARAVRFVSAQSGASGDLVPELAGSDVNDTLVVYMGVGQLSAIERALLDGGRLPGTPVALIENGSRASQRVVHGELQELAAIARAHVIDSPAVLIVGPVAGLGRRLAEFSQPASPPAVLAAAAG